MRGRESRSSWWMALVAGCVLVGACAQSEAPKAAPSAAGVAPVAATTPTPTPTPVPAKDNKLLMATLYMQSSAEYEALCRQVYREATERVQTLTASARFIRPTAVVMDLDETVLDNGWFQAEMIRRGKVDFDSKLWDEYSIGHPEKARLVPGAADFIKACEAAGTTVCFISNRGEKEREATKVALERLGVAKAAELEGVRLLLKTDTSDKEPRRAQVAAKYAVIALVGDNLGDFSNVFDKASGLNSADERRAKVVENADKFGTEWFMLPNAEYGEWTKFVSKDDPAGSLYP